MDYEELRRIQRTEKNNAGLTQIPDEFYTQLSEYINDLIQDYKKRGTGADVRKMENVVRASKDIFHRRCQKIVLHALRTLDENDSAKIPLVEIEKKCYNRIIDGLEEMNDDFENVLTGERPFTGTRMQEEAEKSLQTIDIKEEQGLNTVLVRILKSIPKFVSSDMTELGPFEAHALIKMPESEAHLLVQKGFAEKV